MTNRNFDEWLSKFRPSISSYDYYIDFAKVVRNVDEIKVELNILNSLIGSKNIEEEFEKIVTKYPETLQCVPLLLAVRGNEIYAQDEEGAFQYNFKKMNYSVEQYKRIYSFFLADNADAVIDAGTDKVIFLHHATGKNAGFDLLAFSIAYSKTYSWMFVLIAHRKAPFIVGVAAGTVKYPQDTFDYLFLVVKVDYICNGFHRSNREVLQLICC